MTVLRLSLGILTIVLLAVPAWHSYNTDQVQAAPPPAAQPVPDQKNSFMRTKLKSSQQILEGLTTENFALIKKGASDLNQMTTEEQWRVTNDVLYKQFSKEFQRKTAALATSAKDGTINDVALKWVSVTLSCVECHSHVKGMRLAETDESLNQFFQQPGFK